MLLESLRIRNPLLALASGIVYGAPSLLLPAYLFVGDRTVWGEWLTIWPPALWVLPLALAALLLNRLARMPSRLLSQLVLLAAFLGATTEWRALLRREDEALAAAFDALRARPDPAGPLALRLVSWNVANLVLLDRIEALRPDLVFLQEDAPLGSLSGYWAGFRWIDTGELGVLSRHPIRPLRTERVGPWAEPLLLALQPPDGRTIVLANVRLLLPAAAMKLASPGDPIALASGHRQRLEQFPRLERLLRTAAAELDTRSIILAGDFNTPGGMPSLLPLSPLLSDAWHSSGRGWGGTMTAHLPLSRIDQCWVSDDIRVVAARVHNGGESDHRLLQVDMIVGGR
jgi:endonuclease/exonuclease/phosphatase (EEP) superfamily protein YafD